MEQRRLGRTGWSASILGFGGAYIGQDTVSAAEAEAIVNRALDLGVNYVDTATVYGDSQAKLGRVMRPRRREVFLASKTIKRTRAEAAEELREGLQRLQTDAVDLLLLHGIGEDSTLEQVFGPGGALEAAVEAREAGLTRFIGISSHRNPAVLTEALRRFDFDAALVPVSMLDHFVDDFLPAILPIVRERDMGLVGMKPLASAVLPEVGPALRWAFAQPVHVCIAGMSSLEHVETDAAVAAGFTRPGEAEQEAMLERVRPLARAESLYWRR